MKSPFIYGNIVSSQAFINREKERSKLEANLISGINTMIISPRRWGKSSLVEKVFIDITKNHRSIKTVIIDLFQVGSEEEFLELYAKEIIRASSTKWEDWIKSGKDFFKQLIPKINFGPDPNTDFSISFNWDDLKKNKKEILDLPEKIAKKRGLKFIVGLDEFQNLSTFADYKKIEKNLRAIWQRHKNVSYCIFGSKRHMMSKIFDNSANPFYRFGDIILLEKIHEEDWVNFIIKGFRKTKKNIDKLLAYKIVKLMKSHSWYVQQLSHYTWNITDDIVKNNILKKALEEVISANSPLFQQEIEQLSRTQVNLLKAIVSNEKQLSATSTLNKYQLGTSRNVSRNKTVLQNKDIINKTDERFEFLDPVFEIWFNEYFFNISVDRSINKFTD